MRLIWSEFRLWIDEKGNKQLITSFVKEVIVLREDLNQTNLDRILNSSEFDNIFILWNTFLDYLRNENGDLSSFWMSYIDMMEGTLLNLQRASREGNWFLHLMAIKSMIP